MDYRFEQREGYFVVLASGIEEEVEDLYSYIDAIVAHSRETACQHALLDETQVVMQHDLGDDLDISTSEHAKELADQLLRIACVCKPERHPMVLSFELFAQKRGLNFRGFLSMEEAITWLSA